MSQIMKSRREGVTLAEMLIALTIFGILFGATLGFLDQQSKVFSKGTTQMEALQNMRYTLTTLEKDLQTVGANLVPGQPFIVYAGDDVVSFNGDHSSNIWGDPFAVYVDTAMSQLFANSVTQANRFTIPKSTFSYPDTTYRSGNEISHAETITFYFDPDTTTSNPDDYMLFRKVNDQAPDLISRGLLRQPGLPFFQYYYKVTPANAAPRLDSVPTIWLPLRHSVRMHGSPGDTTNLARIDQLRAVKVNYRTSDGQPQPHERIYAASRTISLPNAGQSLKVTCGDEPMLGAANFTATRFNMGGGVYAARLTWNRATDEGNGEKDVIRYVLYRRTYTTGPFTEPYLSIPAGSSTYTYYDTNVVTGVPYYYALAAQDCTPSLSSQMPYTTPVIP